MVNRDVDARIVQMQFDGRDFDKNIRKSQKSLEDFKKSLNFDDAAKQMSKIGEQSAFGKMLSDMSNNVKKLAKELTGIGSLSSFIAQKFKSAWHGAANAVMGFAKSLTSVQEKAGSEKYDKLLKSVQTIKNATGDTEEVVYSVMRTLNDYTDETSYNFADMAQNIGKFTTAGVKLSDAETEMEGIANWAALAGQGANEAQRAMYNISQAMSAGYMLKIDYKSIQNANMDIRKFRQEALDAAVAAGTLKKGADGVYKTVKGGKQVNLDNFVETLQLKWFDKKTMETVFKTFADRENGIGKEAYKAAQRCFTLKDAIGAWQDMISTGWMKTYEHIFGKATEAMELFSGLCLKAGDALGKFGEIRNGVLEGWKGSGGRNALWGALFGEIETPDGEVLFKGAYGLLDALKDIGQAIKDAFFDFIGNFVDPANKALFEEDKEGRGIAFISAKITILTKQFQEFTGKIRDFLHSTDESGESRIDRIKAIAQAVLAAITFVIDVIKGAFGFVREIGSQLSPAFSAIGGLVSSLLQLFTGDVVAGAKKNVVGNFFKGLAETLKPVTTIISITTRLLAGLTVKFIALLKQSGLFQLLGQAIQFVGGVILKYIVKFINSGTLQMVFGWIQTAISKIPALVQKIRELGSSFVKTAKDSKALKGVKGFFSRIFGGKNITEVLTNLKNNITAIIKKIPAFFTSIKSGGIWQAVSGFFSNLFKNIFGTGDAKAEESTEAIAEAVAAPIEEAGKSDVVGKTIDKLKPSFLEGLKTKIKELWSSITGFFASIGQSEGFSKIKKFFEGTNFQNLLGSTKDIIKWLAIFRAGSGIVSAGKGLKSMGKGIKVFGKNLKNLNLSNIFNIKTMINSGNTDNSKSWNFSNLGPQLLEIAGAIAIIALAASQIVKLKPEEMKKAAIGIGAIMLAMVGIAALAKKFAGNGMSILGMALAVFILLKTFSTIQKIDWPNLLDDVGKLALIMGVLAGAIRLSGKSEGKGFIGLAIGTTLVINLFKKVQKIKWEEVWNDVAILAAIIFTLAGAVRLSGKSEGKGFMGLAIAITILLIPLNKLANMDHDKLLQGFLTIIGLIAMLTVLVAVAKDSKSVAKLSGIVGAIAALVAIAALIGSTMNLEQAIISFAPIILLLGMMSLMLISARKLTPTKIKGLTTIFLAFTAVIAVIAGTTIALSLLKVDVTTIAVFMGGIILILAAFGVMCGLVGSANSKAVSKISIVMLSIAAVVLAAGGALVLMAQYNVDWTVVAAFMAGIVAILIATGVMIKMAFKTNSKGILKAAVVLAAVGLLVAIAGGALALMGKCNVDWGMVAAFMGGLTVLMLGLAVVLPILSKLDLTAALKGILILGVALLAIGTVLTIVVPMLIETVGYALAGLANSLKMVSGLFVDFFDRMSQIGEEQINHALKVFDGIKELVLKFVGFDTHEKDLRSVLSQLNYLGAGLDTFFLNEAKYPDVESSKSFKTLEKLFEISPSLSAFSVGDVPNQLLYLGVGLMLFNQATQDITSAKPVALELLEGIFGQADNITKFSELPIESFAGQMATLGGAMSLYAKGASEVTGLAEDGSDIPDISHSVEILKAVSAAISGEDNGKPFTIPDEMPDDDKIALFASQLQALAGALSSFATAAKEMETDTSKALDLLGFLAQIGGYVTKDNLDVVNRFDDIGHVDANGEGGKLGQFALDIGALGTALSSFADNIGGKEAAFDTGLGVLRRFSVLNANLTKQRLAFATSFNDAGLHETTLNEFATDIGALGRALASFAQNVTLDDGQQADFDYALKSLDFLANLQNKMPNVGGLEQLIHGQKESLGQLGTDIEGLGQGLADFSNKLTTGVDGGKFNVDAATEALDFAVKAAKLIGLLNTEMMNVDGYIGLYADVGSNIGDFISTFDAITHQGYYYKDSNGETIFGSFADYLAMFAKQISDAFAKIDGIDTAALSAFSDIATGLVSISMIDPSYSFEYPGQMISEGIAEGIKKGESKVTDAAAAVVRAAIDRAKKEGDMHSPSKVFTELGEYMDLGLVKGLEGKTDDVENASGDMTQAAIEQAGKVMAAISAAMAENVDLQPTITPVLDLSNITAAKGTLDTIFGGYSLSLGSALEKAAAATTRSGPTEVYVQNPTDLSGIQGTIANLQNDIAGLQTAISNMKIVLNTGAVVGGVSDGVDAQLGLKSFYASRRN